VPDVDRIQVDKIIFACDAGMGVSAMGSSLLKNKFKKENIDIDVTNMAINEGVFIQATIFTTNIVNTFTCI